MVSGSRRQSRAGEQVNAPPRSRETALHSGARAALVSAPRRDLETAPRAQLKSKLIENVVRVKTK